MKIRWREHEFILATVVATLFVAGLIWNFFVLGTPAPGAQIFEAHHFPFNPYRNTLLPDIGFVLLFYGAYLFFTRRVFNPLPSGRRSILNLFILIFLTAAGSYLVVYFKREWGGHTFPNFIWSFLGTLLTAAIFSVYIAVRESIILTIQRSARSAYWTLVCNQVTGFCVIYIIIPLVVAFFRLVHDGEPIAIYFLVTLPLFLLYMINTYWVFPLIDRDKIFSMPALTRITAVALVTSLPILPLPFHEGLGMGFLCCWLIQLVIITPLTWILYQSRKDKILQLRGVETALAKSTGDLQFLKSQINPHFLFNSLNTLYGFAIREEARHTAGGIQKLGDMMRFMLEENTKDRIPLDQEVEYLKNYISLQKMRIDTSTDISVEAHLDPACQEQQIAPMLLIPFVENAFKHGVSLDHRSWIRIDLRCLENRIMFEVRNSRHPTPDNDPEKEKKGIGNKNVTDRLDLIYPSTHAIRFSATETEYIVNLTIHLK